MSQQTSEAERNTQLTDVCIYLFTLCPCPVLPVSRCQARLKLASALGSHMGKCLYGTLLCPEEATNGRLQVNHWPKARRMLVRQHFLTCEAPTQAPLSPSPLPKCGWRWPNRLTSGRLSRQPRESLAQVPDRNRSACSPLHREILCTSHIYKRLEDYVKKQVGQCNRRPYTRNNVNINEN